ncbi:uncharacterized protein LOC121726381 [Aricia agestis]|uniref:uncharacterized protein LOC121726381 n=1 Tax=Aricia agestis TaxID=91739 RepID=UPI001C203EFD|nr:uncharacterized protein LOC121726381 [Aricia agestis]
MPTDIMSTCPADRLGQALGKKNDAEVKSGFLVLVGRGGTRQDVRVVVYRTSLEHFAVMYPRKRLTKAIGVVNLRNTAIERIGSGFSVRQKGSDDTISARFVCSERDIEAWLLAFSAGAAPACPQANLPVLVETEES